MRIRSSALLVCALALAGAEVGCAGPGTSSGSSPVTLGETAADQAVVGLLGERGIACTGTLVASRVVVTAAHCAAAEPLAVFAGSSLELGGAFADVQRAIAHPGFDPVLLDHDIGAVILEAPGLPDIEPASLAQEPLGDSLVGAEVRVVGFGAGGGEEGSKRSGTSRVETLSPSTAWLEPAPSLPCFGDSGGPVLAGPDGGEIIAVTSRGDPACAAFAVATRADAHVGFLAAVIAEHGEDAVEGGCSSVDPGGASGGALLCLCVLLRRRAAARCRARPAC